MTNPATTITDHLDTWSSAIKAKSSAGRGSGKNQEFYGIKKLRELILELAIRGLLVPQDSNEEPAAELLKRVAKEEAQLVKAEKIKKRKSLPKIKESEMPFVLPSTWAWIRLAEAGHDWGQKTPDSDFTYIDVGSINKERGLVANPSVLSAGEAPSRARKIVKKGTIIYSTVRPYLLNIAVVGESFNPEPIASTAFAIVHPFQGIAASFIYRYLRSPSFIKYVENCQTGIAYPAINDKQFFSGILPIPPEAEQHRIVAKVDELMALCDQLEQQQEDSQRTHGTLVQTLLGALTAASERSQYAQAWQRIASHFDTLFTTESSIDQLKQTILQLAVMGKLVEQDPAGESVANNNFNKRLSSVGPFEIPNGWTWTELHKLSEINGGFAFKSIEYNDEGMRVIRISDFDEFGFKDHKVVRHAFLPELEKFMLAERDILMAMTGGTVGKSYLVRSLPEPMIVNQRVATIKVSKNADPSYIDITIKSEMTQEVIRKAKNSTNDNISMAEIKSFEIPLPPIAEQRRIVAKVDELMTLCDRLKANLQTAQTTQLHLADSLVESAIR